MEREASILVVEDDENDIFILERALREACVTCPVQFCRNGVEAQAYLTGEGVYNDRKRFAWPWLIFTDLTMPMISGLEFLKWRQDHEEFKRIPTIVLSASALPSDIEEAYRLGANSYLVKPSDYWKLVGFMKLVLGYWNICQKPQLDQLV